MNREEVIAAVVKSNRREVPMKWISAPGWLREHEDREALEWTPERDAIIDLMQPEGRERPSGLWGIDPRYFRVKSVLMQRGQIAIDIERKRGRR